jgi:VWFA-related protein
MTRTVLRLLGLAAAAATAVLTDTGLQVATSPVTVFVSVADRRHLPIDDLTPSDFTIKEDGKERAVLSVSRASQPIQMVVLVDDSGTGIFRYGLTGLAELLQGRAEILLAAVTNQVQTIVDFTTSAGALGAGIARLGVRPGTPEGGQLIEGIHFAAQRFRARESKRPVIVALTVGGDEQSQRLATDVLDEIWKSRASLHVVFAETIARPTRSVSKPGELLEGNFNLSKVIGDGPKESGGRRRDVLTAGTLHREVQQVALDLLNQYELTYARPIDKNQPRRLQVSVQRPGAEVTAPTRAPSNPSRKQGRE